MKSILGRFMSMWLHPWATMQGIKEEGEEAGIKFSMIFIVAMGLLSGLLTAVMGTVFPQPGFQGGAMALWIAAIAVPILSFIFSFIGAFILWGPFAFGFLKGTLNQYKTCYRLLATLTAFGPVSSLLAPLPKVGVFIGVVINIWALIVMIKGLMIVLETPKVRSIILGVFLGGVIVMGLIFQSVALRQLQGGPGGAQTFGGLDDLNLDEDELNKQLEELAAEAREQQ